MKITPALSLILASTSKFKIQQLSQLTKQFVAIDPKTTEIQLKNEEPDNMAKRLAKEKALSLFQQADSLIIGSDQVVYCDGRVLGKPMAYSVAKEMLAFMSRKSVVVYSAACVFNTQNQVSYDLLELTTLTMRELNNEFIDRYLNKEPDALFCAGATKSEGLGMLLIKEAFTKDPNALIGLPMYQLISVLQKENFQFI